MKFQVFISFKNLDSRGNSTDDSYLAAKIYKHLSEIGFEVFYSNVSLERLGKAAYKKAIDDALDECVVLVVVGSSIAHFESPWVRYEWDSFYNDILSGIRPNNQLFIYADGVDPGQLPRTLRQNQTISHGNDSLETLSNFIKNAVPLQTKHQNLEPKQKIREDINLPDIFNKLSPSKRLQLVILMDDAKLTDQSDISSTQMLDSLPPIAKLAYLDRADLILTELNSIGYSLTPAAQVTKPIRFTPDEMDALAELDHTIWVTHKKNLGWQYAEHKDVEQRLTPWLKSWGKMPQDVRAYVYDTVGRIPALLSRANLDIVITNESSDSNRKD